MSKESLCGVRLKFLEPEMFIKEDFLTTGCYSDVLTYATARIQPMTCCKICDRVIGEFQEFGVWLFWDHQPFDQFIKFVCADARKRAEKNESFSWNKIEIIFREFDLLRGNYTVEKVTFEVL